MAEPASGAAVTAGLGLGAITLTAIAPGVDGDALIGAFAGAAVFAIHSKSLPIYKRLLYMIISMVIGYMGKSEVMLWTGIQSSTIAAFIGSALIVTAALSSIDKIRDFDASKIFGRK